MDRPNFKIIDQVDSIIQDIQEMKSTIPKLKASLNEIASEVSSLPYEARLEVAAYLYWMHPEIKTTILAQATIGEQSVHKFLKAIGPVTAGISCNKCGKEIEIHSRSEFSEKFRWKNHVVCKGCKEIEQAERLANDQEYENQKSKRLHELKLMQYRAYLKTPEWQERRARHLKTVWYRCQVCNTSVGRIDVHHRTYERRGEECFRDLIALCRECHELYHREHKLPKME